MGKRKKISKSAMFKSGYSDPELIAAAMRNPGGGGPQKKKRDRAKWDKQDQRPFQGGAPGLGKRR